MTQARSVVRPRRSAGTIAVTGAAGPLGSGLVDRLAHVPAASKVIALDTERRQVPGVSWRVADVRDPALASRLAGVDTLVHLATDRTATTPAEQRRAVNVRGTEIVLDAAAAAGVRRVVLLTSAMVFGASADNPVPLPEDAPLMDAAADGLVGEWIGMEHAASSRTNRGRTSTRGRSASNPVAVTVVRPASLVGPVSDALLPGLFEAVRLLAIRDACCHWQFCHVDDLLDALVAAAFETVTGVVTVGSEGWLTQAEVGAIAGMRTVVLPSSVAFASAARLHRVGALASPSSDLHYLVHPWVVGSQQLRATGWQPRWTNDAALRDHLRRLGDRAGRSLIVVDRKDATRAAAGATVAVIGSLALARARRRR